MILQTTIKTSIGDIVISELQVKHIYELQNIIIKDMSDIVKVVEQLIPKISNITTEQFKELSMSEVDKFYEAVKEVNKSLFDNIPFLIKCKKVWDNIIIEDKGEMI